MIYETYIPFSSNFYMLKKNKKCLFTEAPSSLQEFGESSPGHS